MTEAGGDDGVAVVADADEGAVSQGRGRLLYHPRRLTRVESRDERHLIQNVTRVTHQRGIEVYVGSVGRGVQWDAVN